MKKHKIKLLAFAGLVFCVILIAVLFTRTTCCSENLNKNDIAKLTELANSGDISAMQRLRFFYEESGKSEQAQYWLEQGVKHNDPLAELHFANQLLGAKKPDEKLGIQYLKAAAEHGEPFAQELLGERYRDGKSVEKRIDLAEYWLRKSAESGSPSAMLGLVDVLAMRAKTKADYLECLRWNEKGLTSPEIKTGGATHIELTEQRERLLKDAALSGISFP